MKTNPLRLAAVIVWFAAAVFGIARVGTALAADAPSPRPMVALLRANPPVPEQMAALLQGLRDVGLENGRNFDLLIRSTENDPSRSAALVAEIVALNPAVVITGTTQLTVEMARASKTIPVVAVTITDPLGLGLAQSIAHPGGNVTGILSTSASTTKLVEMLREIVPTATRIGALINPSNIAHVQGHPKTQAELAAVSLTLVGAEARVASDIPVAFETLRAANVQAMIAGQDPLFSEQAGQVADLALMARLPLAYGFRTMTASGGLMSYGTSLADHHQRAGVLAGKILKGEKPGDLPIEQNAKVELVVNMKTARVLGLTLPPLILARADEIIE